MDEPHLTQLGQWWLDAAREYGIQVVAPCVFDVPGHGRIWAHALIKQFGRERGMVLLAPLPDGVPEDEVSNYLLQRRYGCSAPDDGNYSKYKPGDALSVLTDYEWHGHRRERPAFLGEKLSTRAHRAAKLHQAKVGDRVVAREPLECYGFNLLGCIGVIDRISTCPWPNYDILWEGEYGQCRGSQILPSALDMLRRKTDPDEHLSSLGRWWLRAQQQLGFDASIPYPVTVPNMGTLYAQAYLKDVGSPKGILFMHTLDGTDFEAPLRAHLQNMRVAVQFHKYYPHDPYEHLEPLGILRDCGWHGDPARRPAWLGEDSSTRARRAASEHQARVGDRVQVTRATPYNTRLQVGMLGVIKYLYSTPWPHYSVDIDHGEGSLRADINPADVQLLNRLR